MKKIATTATIMTNKQNRPCFLGLFFFVWSRDDKRFVSSNSVENIYEQTKTVIWLNHMCVCNIHHHRHWHSLSLNHVINSSWNYIHKKKLISMKIYCPEIKWERERIKNDARQKNETQSLWSIIIINFLLAKFKSSKLKCFFFCP